MGGKRIGFVSDLPSLIVEKLAFTNVIFRRVVSLCLEVVILELTIGIRSAEEISCVNPIHKASSNTMTMQHDFDCQGQHQGESSD